MKVGKTKFNWLTEGGFRLDASFHMREGLIFNKLIKNAPLGYYSLKEVTSNIFNGARFKRHYVNDKELGIPFMGSSDMLKSSFDGLKYISKKLSKNIVDLWVKEGWTLVSCSGTIGKTVYANADFASKTASQHIIRVIPNGVMPDGYIYSYLSSKFGYALLTQGTYGAVIQHIEPHHIENLPIPILHELKQKEIHNLIIKASKLREDANKLLKEAISEIESQFIVKRPLNMYSVNIREILKGDKYTKEARLESDYYQPSTINLIRSIQKNEWVYLGDVSSEINRSGLRDRTFVSNGIPLITGQNLNMARLQDLKMLSRKFTRNIEKNTTTDGDILVSVQGTIGKIEYVYKNMYRGVFASEQLSKIKIDSLKIHPGYVACFLKSNPGEMQLLRHKTGSVIEWIKENNIASVVIPMPKDRGISIGEKYNQATLKFEEAFQKENQAIDLVEKEIESWQEL